MVKQFDKDKFKFYMKHLIPYGKFNEFKEQLKNAQTAIEINPDLAEEVREKWIKDYPFLEEFL